MKNKLDWFDDNWNWDVRSTRVLHELLLSPTYRWPRKVNEVCSYKQGAEFPRCPRCGSAMDLSHELWERELPLLLETLPPLRGEQQATIVYVSMIG